MLCYVFDHASNSQTCISHRIAAMCQEARWGHQLIFATINRLTLVVTSPQTQCVVFVRQPLQTQTVGTIHHCQIIRSRSASSEATKHYAREVTIAYWKPTKSIVLSGTLPILTKDHKRLLAPRLRHLGLGTSDDQQSWNPGYWHLGLGT